MIKVKRTALLLQVLFAAIFAGCDDMTSVLPDISVVETETQGALYILCDGNYSLNNSTLALYDFKSKNLNTDFFQAVNGRKLGDTGNEIKRYGSKIYMVVNVSSQIEVIDAKTGISLKQIPFFDGEKSRQPRYMTFWEDKLYVCSFDGTIAKIDTASLEVEAFAQAGRNPDGLTVSNNKIYVSNSGGLDFSTTLSYDNTVSVIDIATFRETKEITVGTNPYKIMSDNYGYVWVVCRGDYENEKTSWMCINSMNDRVVATYDIAVMNFDIFEDMAYLYQYDSKSKESYVKVFNLNTREVVRESFISDATEIVTPYGISVNQDNGDVFITDAGNYVSAGHIYCFRNDGTLKYKIKQVGVSPNSVVFASDFIGNTQNPGEVQTGENFIEKVLDFSPAPGQFIGTYPVYDIGDSDETMRMKAESQMKGKTGGLVSLGRYGGSITFSFKKSVLNISNSNDFKIYGNAFNNSAEPGIVEVSVDENGNGKADDKWFELAGSEYSKDVTLKSYNITYYRPTNRSDSIKYKDSKGNVGYVTAYYPFWKGDSIAFAGTLLAPTAIKNNETGFWTLYSLPWGYADNKPNTSDLSDFDLDWAVDSTGNKVNLPEVNFIRVYTGVNQNAGWVGEISAEITGAENLSR